MRALPVAVLVALAGCSGAGGPTLACDFRTDCEGGVLLGSVSGDQRSPALGADGLTSAWVLVRVTEDLSSVAGRPLRVTATLTSPPGVDFELHAHGVLQAPDGGVDPAAVSCAAEVGQAVTRGRTQTLDLSWGEQAGAYANGVDDGRTLALEVRHRAGPCGGDASWTLTVQGN
jgi:hypothetical protein